MSAKKAITEPQSVPNYYAVIPASVRYDDQLPGRAALLYGEITALANTEGYCWASNSYFAGLYHVSADTIRTWIQALEARGHIKRVEIRDDNNAVVERRIYVTDPPLDNSTPSPENPGEAPRKNPQENNTRDNNIPPYIPPQGGEQAQEEKTKRRRDREQKEKQRAELTEWFDKTWLKYPYKAHRATALKAWLTLAPDVELARTIYRAVERQTAAGMLRPRTETDHYTPLFSTWLNGQYWLDELPQTGAQSPPCVRMVEDDEVRTW